MSMAMESSSDILRSEFVTGLVNLHAVEKQALQLIERQLERVRSYPDVAMRLRQHLDETKVQEERLDSLLQGMNESSSMLKDMAMQFTANMGAMAHAAASDEILKNSFANLAFENFEIASYKSAIAMAEMGGFNDATRVLQQSLREEEDTAAWFKANIETITRQYLELKARGEKSDR
jgi:ferritin-like metal-binding protein YciE